jgi:hypothetical protein
MKVYSKLFLILGAVALALVLTIPAQAQLPPPTKDHISGFPGQKHYSPYAGRSFPTNVYWGDTHLHTGMSMDAGAFGARLLPKDAYLSWPITRTTWVSFRGWLQEIPRFSPIRRANGGTE